MKAYVNGITFTQLWSGEECAIVHTDATIIDTDEETLDRQLYEGVYDDFLIPELYKGRIFFEKEIV